MCQRAWICCGPHPDRARVKLLEQAGVRVLAAPRDAPTDADGGLTRVIQGLAGHGLTRLLVEGGPILAAAFEHARLTDEYALFQCTRGIDPGEGTPIETLWTRERLAGLEAVPVERLGDDRLQVFRQAGGASG